jgi:hypothetical protein
LEKFAEIFASQCASPVSTTPVANLPPVSTTPAANFATSTAGVVDTGGNLHLAPCIVHLELVISPRIFEKIRGDITDRLRGLGELIHEKI